MSVAQKCWGSVRLVARLDPTPAGRRAEVPGEVKHRVRSVSCTSRIVAEAIQTSSFTPPEHDPPQKVSSSSDAPDESPELTERDELSPQRENLLLSIAYLEGAGSFERRTLRDKVEESDTLGEVVDEPDTVPSSLNDTRRLNSLQNDGYLDLLHQGGNDLLLIDHEADEDLGEREAVPFPITSAVMDLAHQVLDREGLSDACLDDVDPDRTSEVKNAVNRAVNRSVLYVSADSSEYRLTKEAIPVVDNWVESALEES